MRYQLPATFFIISGNIDLAQEFWWDELAGTLLLSPRLPPSLSLALPGEGYLTADLLPEQLLTPALRQQHQLWRVGESAPPTRRSTLFYELWQRLQLMPAPTQQLALQHLRAWAGWPATPRPSYQSMSGSQLRKLSANPLFTIGAHSVTHPALASHPAAVQEQELAAGRQALREATGQPVELLAYPYGNYSRETEVIADQLRFKAAFTTKAHLVTTKTEVYALGRFQVSNWHGDQFKQHLAQWFKSENGA